ncbi:MAG: hypothetical protein HY904_20505 [Deltaproteobacteria bacterium]|nr:hypothetical protein [Deltaproteobacteria bacterium]
MSDRRRPFGPRAAAAVSASLLAWAGACDVVAPVDVCGKACDVADDCGSGFDCAGGRCGGAECGTPGTGQTSSSSSGTAGSTSSGALTSSSRAAADSSSHPASSGTSGGLTSRAGGSSAASGASAPASSAALPSSAPSSGPRSSSTAAPSSSARASSSSAAAPSSSAAAASSSAAAPSSSAAPLSSGGGGCSPACQSGFWCGPGNTCTACDTPSHCGTACGSCRSLALTLDEADHYTCAGNSGALATACSISTCSNATANCDGNDDNACEVNIHTDAQHCGSCATTCAGGQTCSDGAGSFLGRCECGDSGDCDWGQTCSGANFCSCESSDAACDPVLDSAGGRLYTCGGTGSPKRYCVR